MLNFYGETLLAFGPTFKLYIHFLSVFPDYLWNILYIFCLSTLEAVVALATDNAVNEV
jgi:hypothetical protein